MKASTHDDLIKTLKERFLMNMRRHAGIEWESVEAKLMASPKRLRALNEMERTGRYSS